MQLKHAPRGVRTVQRMEGEGRNKVAQFVEFSDSDKSSYSDSSERANQTMAVGEGLGIKEQVRPSMLMSAIQFTADKKSAIKDIQPNFDVSSDKRAEPDSESENS
jgi:hypothetical protein